MKLRIGAKRKSTEHASGESLTAPLATTPVKKPRRLSFATKEIDVEQERKKLRR